MVETHSKKEKAPIRIEGPHLVVKEAWPWIYKILNTSIFKTSKRKSKGEKKYRVKRTYGMLLESVGNSIVKIGRNKIPVHYIQHEFISSISEEYDRLIVKERRKKIKKEEIRIKEIEQIKKEKKEVIERLKNINFSGKITNLNNCLDRKSPGDKFIEKTGEDYKLLIFGVIGSKNRSKLFCSKNNLSDFRDFIEIETQVKEKTNVQMVKGLLEPSPEEQDRVRNVYVKPKGYDKALEILKKNKLLFISGIKESGKTAMAHYLSLELEKNGSRRIWWIDEFSKTENLSRLMDASNDVIVFNDVFGKAKLSIDTDESIKHLADYLKGRNNYIIMTSRDSTLEELNKVLPTYYEEFLSDYEFKLKSGSYTDVDLGEVLDNHIQYVRKKFSDDLQLAEKDKLEIIRSLRLPLHIFILTTRKLKLVQEGEITLKKAIEESKKLRKTTRNWYLNIRDQEDQEFMRLIALFPGMPRQDFRRVYEKMTGKALEYYRMSNLRERSREYVHTEGNVDFIHPDCFEGVWDAIIKEGKEAFSELLPNLLDLMEDMSTRLQASYCLKEIGMKESDLVLSGVEKRLHEDDLYKKHMLAYIIGELGKENGITSLISSITKDLLIKTEGINDRIEGVYVLKKIGKKRGVEICRFLKQKVFQQIEDKKSISEIIDLFGRAKGDIDYTMGIMEMLKNYCEDSFISKRVEKNLEKLKQRKQMDQKMPKGKNLVKNPDFREGLKYWQSTGEESISYKVDKNKNGLNGKNCCHGIEKRKDNLGRLYQNLTPLLDKKIIMPGKKYRLSGYIKTIEVKSDETYRRGAVIGVGYVDEEGWTPRIEAFQCEIGKNVNTTDGFVFDEGTFILDPLSSESTSLWIYFDFNGAKGEAFFSDVSLEEVEV